MTEQKENGIEERMQLVTERMESLRQEETDVFWLTCFRLAEGSVPDRLSYLDYSQCREQLGHRQGVYLCVLYAQLLQTAWYLQSEITVTDGRMIRLACITRELLVQMYLMVRDGESPEAIRDALYWFYYDSYPLFAEIWQLESDNGKALSFGGPMLFGIAACTQAQQDWSSHRWDCGLFLGKRFERLLVQAVKDTCTVQEIRMLTGLLPQAEEQTNGFLLTAPQREVWQEMIEQLHELTEK